MNKVQLVKLRSVIKARITKFSNYIFNINESTDAVKALLTFKRNSIQEYFEQFVNIQNELEEVLDEIELDEALDYKSNVEELYFNAIVQCKKLENMDTNVNIAESIHEQSNAESVNAITVNSSNISTNSNFKLPTIDLPKFSGTFEEWLEFKSKFETIIHNNNLINDIDKFHYLRSCLTGAATQIISSLDFTASNYKAAWDFLINRFSKSSLLVHNHLKAIMELQHIKSDSAVQIRNFCDKINKHLHCLSILGEPVKSWDTILLYILTSKLDMSLFKDWEKEKRKLIDTNKSFISSFFSFLESRAEFLETFMGRSEPKKQVNVVNKKAFVINKSAYKCYYCQKNHSIFKCKEFLALEVKDRIAKVNALNLCKICFMPNHKTEDCQKNLCKICNSKHNILLHLKSQFEEQALCVNNKCSNNVLLATACVLLTGRNGDTHYARALLDSGSQANFITEEFQMLLNIPKVVLKNHITTGIGNLSSSLKASCYVSFKSVQSNFKSQIKCYVMEDITGQLPSCPLNLSEFDIPSNVQLADPQFYHPKKVDLLLGAEIFWRIIKSDFINLNLGGLILRDTELGWVVSGPLSKNNFCNVQVHVSTLNSLQDQLQKFWNIEESIDTEYECTNECETLFKQTTARGTDGKFIVKYPFNKSIETLSCTKSLALKRFQYLERKFSTNNKFKIMYHEFIREYIDLGHMSLVENLPEKIFYMPHHGVLRDDSETTKLRVVFDGSARGVVGCSLNEIQFTGPKIQEDIISLILRFRQHKIVIGADIEKMYRMIWITEEQRDLQLILWRFAPELPLQTYRLNTVTYGTTSAPYLAIRCLKELGYSCAKNHPKASEVILKDFYVDDLLTGGESVSEVLEIANTVSNILITAGLNLRKWVSNSKEVINCFKDKTKDISFGTKTSSKLLGVHWMSDNDILYFKINLNNKIMKNSKRAILSGIAQIFDPLGLLAPVIIQMKILIQEIWTLKLGWDDEVPLDIQNKWECFKQDIPVLNLINIPRWVLSDNIKIIELHGFADASQVGYGACLYIRTISILNTINVNLLCAKSRVAPLKTLTIPRLELSAIVLLVDLYKLVKKSMSIKFDKIYFWSDSTIALHWLATSPNLLQTFVANRVAKVQTLTNLSDWKHIRTIDNPADIISRGVKPSLLDCDFWWHGPHWLQQDILYWPTSVLEFNSDPPEIKKTCLLQSNVAENRIIEFKKYSNYTRLLRTVGYVLRFINNIKNPITRFNGSLSPEELKLADNVLIKLAQYESFQKEIELLKTGKFIQRSLNKLHPFLDNNGILRVGGRLNSPMYSFMKKHPALLNSKHFFTRLIFKNIHNKYFHLGPTALLANAREKYWPIAGRSLARKTVFECIECFKSNPVNISPIMGDLPKQRIEVNYPFSIVGIDYAGPILIKNKNGRGSSTSKAYFAVFICFTTKAIHIETISSLSTNAFLAALNRFVARRGCPSDIYSDNGKNFVGANKELSLLTKLLLSNKNLIQDNLSKFYITWHFNPPYAPHFGGLWERSIKSIKYHLKRAFTNTKFTFEELSTALIQIEGILNMRPLCYLSNDPIDLEPITPSHFLIGRRLDVIPEYSSIDNLSRLSKTYKSILQVKELFWKRWLKEYLSELQVRSKQSTSKGELKENMLVIIKDNNPIHQWKIGRIIKLFKGRDDIARVAEVKTNSGNIIRSFSKLCPLPVSD